MPPNRVRGPPWTPIGGQTPRRFTALAMAKARGVKLGRPENLSRQAVGSVRGNEAKASKGDDEAKRAAIAEHRRRTGYTGAVVVVPARMTQGGCAMGENDRSAV
jgi:hypothetical protein